MKSSTIIMMLLILTFPLLAADKIDVPEIIAVRADEKITVDGKLNEAIWLREGYDKLVQRDPIEGADPTQKTFVLLAYNDEGLFVAGTCFHNGKISVAGGLSRRDKFVESDWFWFYVDPNFDRQNAFGFAVNPDGSIIDQKYYRDIYYETDWDGVWSASAQKGDNHWTFEMFIPFSQLRFDKKDEYVWGVNFKRYILTNAEEDYFVMVPRNETGFVSRFGKLTGLKDVAPPARLFISPYSMAKLNDYPDTKKSPFYNDLRYGKNLGLDIKYGLTGNLTLDVAINPDFGQAEVDPAVINLSAFETYYSEKRSFFLEGSDIFYFGANPTNGLWGCYWNEPILFYSRRIGRQPNGPPIHKGEVYAPEQTSILGATKVSGKIGKWSIGGISAMTQQEFATIDSSGIRFREAVEPLTYYGVYRGMREFDEGRQGLGFIVTNVYRNQSLPQLKTINNQDAIVTGLDGWSYLGAKKNWAFLGKAAYSHINGSKERILSLQKSSTHYYQRPDFNAESMDPNRTSLSGYMGRFGLLKTNGNIQFQSALGFISPGFNINDLGYSSYGNLINMHIVGGYRWLKPTSWYRRISLYLMTSRNFDFDSNRLFSQYYSSGSILLPNYFSLNGSVQITPDGLSLFATRGGPIAAYPGYIFSDMTIASDDRKPIQAEFSYIKQSTKDGGNFNLVSFTWIFKLAASLKLTLSTEYSQELDHHQWVANIPDPQAKYGYHYIFSDIRQKQTSSTIRMDWGITPKLSLQMYLQPFIASGDYENFKELARARSYDYDPYPYDGRNPDFNYKSFKGNFVLRWEYLPGSLLYMVWTQSRDNFDHPGDLNFRRDMQSLFQDRSDNIFFVKMSYMLSLY
jgi:hypothetical protein